MQPLRRSLANRSSTTTIIRDSRIHSSTKEHKVTQSLRATTSLLCRCLTPLHITALAQQLQDETKARWIFTRKELQTKICLNSEVMPSTTRWINKWRRHHQALRTKISVSNQKTPPPQLSRGAQLWEKEAEVCSIGALRFPCALLSSTMHHSQPQRSTFQIRCPRWMGQRFGSQYNNSKSQLLYEASTSSINPWKRQLGSPGSDHFFVQLFVNSLKFQIYSNFYH